MIDDPLVRLDAEARFLTALHQQLEQIAQTYRAADMSRDQVAPLAELSTTILMRADELRAALEPPADTEAAL